MTVKLYNNDCFNIFPTIEKNTVDLVLVDLPYGCTNNKWDVIIDLKEMWKQLYRICKINCAMIFFCNTKFGFELINSNKKYFRYDLVWHKTMPVGFLNSKVMPLKAHEMLYIFYKKKPVFNPQKFQGKPYIRKAKEGVKKNCDNYRDNVIDITNENLDGMRFPLSVLNFSNGNSKSIHPTMKPVDLLEWLIKSYSNEGNLVLDFCMGSGSCGLACQNTGRSFIGVEKEIKYFEKCLVKSNE
jgi:site-specific DNA-methyltransferase (adenine-specific)